jgi:hypothetical protein
MMRFGYPAIKNLSPKDGNSSSGFRIRQVDEFSDYLKASTDVFQQIHSPNTEASGDAKVSKQVEQ